MKDFTATIREGSEREQDWLKVFGSRNVVLSSPIPQWASVPGKKGGATLVYLIDLAELSTEQRARLSSHLAQRFGLSVEEVETHLDQVGCPILADDVTVTVFNPQRWF